MWPIGKYVTAARSSIHRPRGAVVGKSENIEILKELVDDQVMTPGKISFYTPKKIKEVYFWITTYGNCLVFRPTCPER